MAPRARQAKSKARIQKYEELASEEQYEKIAQNEIVIPPAPRLGNDVVIAKELKKAYGDKLLFDDLTFSLPRGGIVGIIGPNGAGKTTLFRMIIGQRDSRTPGRSRSARRCSSRTSTRARTLDREQDGVGGDLGRPGCRFRSASGRSTARAYLSSFNFRGTDQQKKVGEPVGR